MRKSRVVWIAVCGALLAGIGWFAIASAEPRGPEIQLPPLSLDLGDGPPGEEIHGDFVLWNRGDRPLEFNINASCGCTQLSPRRGTIDPANFVKVYVGVKLQNQVGTSRDLTLQIESNDPKFPQLQYQIFARCPTPLRVVPSSAFFGRLFDEDKTIRLAAIPNTLPEKPLAAEQLNCRLERGHSFLRLAKIEVDDDRFVVPLEFSSSAPHGRFDDRLIINYDGLEMSVPISGSVVGVVSVAPNSLVLQKDAASGNWRLLNDRLLLWRNDGRELGPPARIECPTFLTVRQLETAAPQRSGFQLTLAELDQDPGENVFVSLEYTGSPSPMTVSVPIVTLR